MTNVVLDTSAVMAWLQQEPGWEAVGRAFATENCRMSAVNLAELVAKSAERMRDHAEIAAMIAELLIEIVPFDHSNEGIRLFTRNMLRGGLVVGAVAGGVVWIAIAAGLAEKGRFRQRSHCRASHWNRHRELFRCDRRVMVRCHRRHQSLRAASDSLDNRRDSTATDSLSIRRC